MEKYLPPDSCRASSASVGLRKRSWRRFDLFTFPKMNTNLKQFQHNALRGLHDRHEVMCTFLLSSFYLPDPIFCTSIALQGTESLLTRKLYPGP